MSKGVATPVALAPVDEPGQSGGPRDLAGSEETPLLEMGPRLFSLIIESGGDGILEWDLVGDRIRYSARLKTLLGYEESQVADVPASWRALTHPDDLPGVERALRDHIEDFWPFAHSWRMRHHNGEWRWILCRATCERDEREVATRLVAVFTDINDQVVAEQRQKALVTAVPDLMLRLRRDGLILDQKQAAAPHARFSQIKVGHPLVDDAGGVAWSNEIVAAAAEAISTGRIVERECVAAADELFVELRVVRSGPEEAVCIVREISARRLAEQRQRDLQAQIAAMLEAERDRLASELEIARHIQTSLLPTIKPMSSLDACIDMSPASEVGGDYLDLLPCDDGAWLAIGDVSGHGVNAGMIMLMVQSAIASVISHDPGARPSAVLRSVNQTLYANIRNRMDSCDFVTCTLLRYWNDGRLMFAGAHEEILMCRANQRVATFIPTTGSWLGVLPNLGDLADQTEQLQPDDLLVLFTDGITEARNASGKQFGAEGLATTVLEVRDRKPSEIRDHVRQAVRAWAPSQEDDRSLLVARHRRS